jgi:hypothetical protein
MDTTTESKENTSAPEVAQPKRKHTPAKASKKAGPRQTGQQTEDGSRQQESRSDRADEAHERRNAGRKSWLP